MNYLRSFAARMILLSLIILGLFLAPGLLSARAAIVYVPGVKPGDSAVYAQTVGRWNLPGPPNPVFGQFINLNFTTLSVTSVTGSNVTAAQTSTYVNGTVRHDNILGSVATDAGNITFWFTATNLTTGDPIYTTPNAPVINRTMTLVFAGAPRAVNIFNTTLAFPGGTEFVNAWWDRLTGILVHVDFAIKTTTGNAFAGAQLVKTNLWNPVANLGIGLFAFPTPLLIARGISNSSTLEVISERGFAGTVTIVAQVQSCTSGCPTVKVNPATFSLPAGVTALSLLNVSTTASTGLGFYAVVVTASSTSPNALTTNSTTVGVNVVQAGVDEFPTAMLSFSPPNPIVGQTLLFSGSGSFDPDGSIVSYNFTFSDFSRVITNSANVTHIFTSPGLYNAILTVTDSSNLKGFAFASVNVAGNQTNEAPVADFFVRVSNASLPIRAGQLVTFDGSPSFDPDGFITFYSWNFGDGSSGSGQLTSHSFLNPGNYTVSLTVTDSSSKTASAHHTITVLPAIMHDVGIVNVDPEPKTVISGQQVFVRVDLVNLGLQPENVTVTVRFNSQVAATQHFTNIPVTGSFPFPYTVTLFWDTTGVAAGNYTISASVFLATDQNPSNNQFTDGLVNVLPPPVLTATPSQGPVGTKVTVHGSGFLVNNQPFQSVFSVEVTFDDQLIGFQPLSNTGSFDFVFNVPVSQVDPHEIHAYVQLYPGQIEASTGFTVVPGPASVSLTVSVGAIYFPGDTAAIYVLSTANGSPANAGTVSLTLLLPNGTGTSLALAPVSTGVYKATYTLPGKNSIGTYGLVASSTLNGASASALASFEVKPTWLQSNSRTLTGGLAVAGALGVVALAWKKGYLTRRKDEFPFA